MKRLKLKELSPHHHRQHHHHHHHQPQQCAKIAITQVSGSSNDVAEAEAEEADEKSWRERLARNNRAVYITIYCLSLEVPYRRYILKRPLSVALACLRCFGIAAVLLRLILFLVLSDCEHAPLRAYLYDWTVFYPSGRRTNIQRIFIGGIVFHLCLKISIFYYNRKPFDASLIDYLCSKPPTYCEWTYERAAAQAGNKLRTLTTSDMQFRNFPLNGAKSLADHKFELKPDVSEAKKDSSYLRDRLHWFKLSDILWRQFKANAIVVLSLCALIASSANIRLAFVYDIERECDVEMPFLRQLGLLELNFFLIECTQTLIGSFSFCSMIKHDLMVQAEAVEQFLLALIADMKLDLINKLNLLKCSKVVATEASLQQSFSKNLPSLNLATGSRLAFSGFKSVDVDELIFSKRAQGIILDAPNHKLLALPSKLTNQSFECAPLYSLHQRSFGNFEQVKPRVRSDIDDIFGASKTNLLDLIEEASAKDELSASSGHLAHRIIEAQSRIILFLKCLDSHKRAINFVGNAFLLYMATSIGFVPLLIVSIRSERSEQISDLAFAIACLISLFTGLMFTYIGATVHQRAIGLTSLMYRLCSLFHSKAVAVRWNKIFMIWYCPARCAFKVSGMFELTHLNMLKAISFLISGLTLVLNYLG